ncbi:transporter substrate-binding domain-containing protein [Micromonospora sp. NPDC005189]|uniref:transporter substrate-binding domain-containing protein n=1 Tax=unclassified Micromonospora TaxID=2617518 RepID=UPI0033B5C0F0
MKRALLRKLGPLAVSLVLIVGAIATVNKYESFFYLRGDVRVGINGILPGWSNCSVSCSTSDATGFDVQLVKFLAEKYNFSPVFKVLAPDERERALVNGEIDLVVANFSMDGISSVDPTKKRREKVNFAGPYFLDQSGVMYSKAKRDKYYKDDPTFALEHPNALPPDRICLSKGTTAPDYLNGKGRVMDQKDCFSSFGKSEDPILGAITDETILRAYSKAHYPEMSAAPAIWEGQSVPIHKEKYGIGTSKDDSRLCHLLAQGIEEFLSDPDNTGRDRSRWQLAFDDNLAASVETSAAEHRPKKVESFYCD